MTNAAVTSLFSLEGRTILVTGASSGIGEACAQELARAGARIILTGRNFERLSQVSRALVDNSHRIIPADLTYEDQLDSLSEKCPAVDGIVHSAGIRGLAPMHLVQKKILQQTFDSNYFAPITLTQRLLKQKKVNPNSSILFMSSVSAKAGDVGVGPYAGTKAALIGSMRPLALEVAKHGVRVNSLCPGIVVTPLFAGLDDWLTEKQAAKYPLGLGRPEDIAYAARFFMSAASSKITGADFSIDGGVLFV